MEGTQCAAIIPVPHCFPPISFVEFLETVIWDRDCFTVGLYIICCWISPGLWTLIIYSNKSNIFWLCRIAFLLLLWQKKENISTWKYLYRVAVLSFVPQHFVPNMSGFW